MLKRNPILKCCCFFLCMYLPDLLIGQSPYIDGRPWTNKRMVCQDYGIVLRYGDGPDSCDVYGAREANVNKENGLYYLFYDGFFIYQNQLLQRRIR